MGEAILAKAVGFKPYDPLDDVQIAGGICRILARVVDSDGSPVNSCYVTCKDGETWYNYHTNEKGYVLFSTNSGAANITALNYSIAGSFNIVDQKPSNTYNIDAPTSTKMSLNIPLIALDENKIYFTSNANNIKFQAAKELYVQMVGGGSGGSSCINSMSNQSVYSGGMTRFSIGGNGGGGGAYNEISISGDPSVTYNLIIGVGGASGGLEGDSSNFTFNYGASGGTTSGFGISAVGGYANGKGGGTGDYKGGDGGYLPTQQIIWNNTVQSMGGSMAYQNLQCINWAQINNKFYYDNINGISSNYVSSSFPYGGGGGVGYSTTYWGKNLGVGIGASGGADGRYYEGSNYVAAYGGGGGGASKHQVGTDWYQLTSSNGGNGLIVVTF